MPTIQALKVFVSSPGDVPDERQRVLSVIARLNASPEWSDLLTLKAQLYDDPDYPVGMEAGVTPQTSVNRYLARPSACEITVLILWGRLGTPLADVTRADGSRYESGTVWEYEDALAAGRPVFVFRRDEPPRTPLGDDKKVAQASAQYRAVQAFFDQRFSNPDGSLKGGVNTYKTLDEFEHRLESALRMFVARHLAESAPGPGAPAPGPSSGVPYLAPDHTRRDYDLVRRVDPGKAPDQDDVATVWAKVAAGHDVALTFLPGVGKSTLAEEVVAQRELVLGRFEGVLWADVGRRPETLAQFRLWADALGISLLPGDAGGMTGLPEAARALRAAIGRRRLLVVLDDVWEERHAREYMELGPDCVFIITTRVRQLALKLVKQADVVAVRELMTEEGLRLIRSIAPDAVKVDPDEVRNLVRAVRGLPLALVLMGMYLKLSAVDPNDQKGIRDAFARLKQAGKLLKERAADGRQDTMEQIIDVSYEALSDAGKRALPRLAVLRSKPHGFDEAMARDICKVDPEVIRTSLVPMGLVEFKSDNDFTIHPIIATHGLGKLSQQRRKELYRNALDWYGRQLTGAIDADPDSYQDWYRYEKADWQATKDSWLYYLAACGNSGEAMLAFLRVFFDAFWWWGYYQRFPFCERLIREWQLRALGDDQRRGLAELLKFHNAYPEGYVKTGHAERWKKVEEALEHIRKALGLDGAYDDIEPGDARRVRSFLDFFLAECLAYGHGDRAAALTRYTAAHDQFVQDGVPWVPAWIWFYVGQYLLDIGEPAGALDYTRRALGEAGEDAPFDKRDPELLANLYRVLGDLQLHAGDEDTALAQYQRAMLYAFAFQAVPEPADTYTVEFYREIAGRIGQALATERTRSVDRALRLARRLHQGFDAWWQAEGGGLDEAGILSAMGGDGSTIEARLFPAVPTRETVAEGQVAVDFQARVRAVLPTLRAAAGIHGGEDH